MPQSIPQFHRDNLSGLRCAEVQTLNVPLLDLEPHMCRWPVSGEREHTLFCARRRLEDSSYCPEHQRLSVGPGTPAERRAA